MSLERVNEEISTLSIAVSDFQSHRRHGSILERHQKASPPVGSLIIPNKLSILWMKKLKLGCQQCMGSIKYAALVNANIKDGDIQLSETSYIELRLQMFSECIHF